MSKQVTLNTAAPDFELEDFNGQAFKLSNYLAKKNVILIFNRSFL
jgi:peroxiredoxin